MRRVLSMGLSLVVVISSVPLAFAVQKQDPETPEADARLFVHKNGATTVTVDGKEHPLAAGEFRGKAKELLTGKKHLVFEMEDWSGFETVATEQLSGIYQLGIRTLTLQIDHEGKKETRTVQLSPPSLEDNLLRGSAEDRKQALETISTMLEQGDINDRVNAMTTLRRVDKIRFDRSRFLPLVRKALDSPDKSEISAALGVIASVGGDVTDIPKVLSHADAKDPSIRAWISTTLRALDPKGSHPDVGPAIAKLLGDKNNNVRTATIKSLWGVPVSPEADAVLIELSKEPMDGGSGEGYTTIYYALSTRPLIRKPVAERLIELTAPNTILEYRAVWGISHHQCTEDAQPIVVDALIRTLDSTIDEQTRHAALYGLGFHGGDKAIQKLQAVANNPNESQATRKLARKYLPASARADMPAEPNANVPVKVPDELWEQLVQVQKPELRDKALTQVRTMLTETATAKDAMSALVRAAKVPFAKEPFIPLIRPYLESDDPNLRAPAIAALATCGPKAIDCVELVGHARDTQPLVRQAVAESVFVVDPNATNSETPSIVETLLLDSDPKIVQSMIQAVWGHPTSLTADRRLVELSFHSDLGDTAIYYGLSTRPLIRDLVARRLIELAQTSDEHQGRAIWGLSHHAIDDEAKDQVVEGLIAAADRLVDGYDRNNAIYGLAKIGGEAALTHLRGLADSPQETEYSKKHIRDVMQRFGR